MYAWRFLILLAACRVFYVMLLRWIRGDLAIQMFHLIYESYLFVWKRAKFLGVNIHDESDDTYLEHQVNKKRFLVLINCE